MIADPNKFGRQDTQTEFDIQREQQYDQMLGSELETGFSVAEAGRAAAEEGWITSLGTVGRYALGWDETGEELTPDQVAEQFDGMKVGSNMHYGEALRLSDQRDNRAYADFVMQNVNESSLGSSTVPFLAGLAGNIADPATLALGAVAAIAISTGVPSIAGMGVVGSTSIGTFVASSLIEWGFEEALYHKYYEDMFNEEYTAQDSAMNLIAAFALGGVIEFGSGSLKSIYNKGSAKTKELITNYQAGTHASGRKTDLVTLEKTIWEDVWNGSSRGKHISATVDQLKGRKLYGVKMIEGPSKGSGDRVDMDTNHSKDATVYTSDDGMASKNASDNNHSKVEVQIKPEARILDLDNPEPGVLEAIIPILPDDGLGGKVYEDMTLSDIVELLNTPTENSQINMKRQKALQAIDDLLISQGYDGTKKVGGRIHGEKFDGQYEHDAVTIYNQDAVIETDMGKPGPNDGKRGKERKLKGEEIHGNMVAPESQKGYDPEMETHMDDMADEFSAITNKAPDDPTPENMKSFDDEHYKQVAEEGNALSNMVEDMKLKGDVDPKIIASVEKKLESLVRNHKDWSPEAREGLENKRRTYDVCMLGGK